MSEKPITQRIKDRLAAYTAMLRDIDNQLERLDRMEMTMASPPGPDLTGMPRGSGTPSDRTGMMVERKMELEEQIDRLKAEEKQERNAIEGLILQLSDPDERAVIRLRYFDRADWESTCGVLFGDRRDYVDRVDAYSDAFIKNKPAIPKAVTKTVQTLSDAASKSFAVTGYILSVILIDSATKEQVIGDISFENATASANGKVTVTLAAAPSNPILVIITSIAL